MERAFFAPTFTVEQMIRLLPCAGGLGQGAGRERVLQQCTAQKPRSERGDVILIHRGAKRKPEVPSHEYEWGPLYLMVTEVRDDGERDFFSFPVW